MNEAYEWEWGCRPYSVPTIIDDVTDIHVFLGGDEAKDGEDDESCENTGGTVDAADDDGVTVTVVTELVVTRHGDQTSWACAEWVEDLCSSVAPDSGIQQLVEVGL